MAIKAAAGRTETIFSSQPHPETNAPKLSPLFVFGDIGDIDMADDGKGGERIAKLTQRLAGVGCDYVDAHWNFKMMKRTNQNQMAVSKFKCNVFFPNIVFDNDHRPSFIAAADAYAFATRIQDAVLGAGLAWNADDWSYRLDNKNILVTYAARPLDIEAKPNNIANVIAAITDPAFAAAAPPPVPPPIPPPVPPSVPVPASDVWQKFKDVMRKRSMGQLPDRDISDLVRMVKAKVAVDDDQPPRGRARTRRATVGDGDADNARPTARFVLNPNMRPAIEAALQRVWTLPVDLDDGRSATIAERMPFDVGADKDAFLARLRDHPWTIVSSDPQTFKCGFVAPTIPAQLLLDRAVIFVMGINQTSALDQVLKKIDSRPPSPAPALPGTRRIHGLLNRIGADDIYIDRLTGDTRNVDTVGAFFNRVRTGAPCVLATLANHAQITKIAEAIDGYKIDRRGLAVIIDEAHELVELDATMAGAAEKKKVFQAIKGLVRFGNDGRPAVGSLVLVSATNVQWPIYAALIGAGDDDVDIIDADQDRLRANGYVGIQHMRPSIVPGRIDDATAGPRLRSADGLALANVYGRDSSTNKEDKLGGVPERTIQAGRPDADLWDGDIRFIENVTRQHWYPEVRAIFESAFEGPTPGFLLETCNPGRSVDRNCTVVGITVLKEFDVDVFVVHGGDTVYHMRRREEHRYPGPIRGWIGDPWTFVQRSVKFASLDDAREAIGTPSTRGIYVISNCVRGAVSLVYGDRAITHMITGSMQDANLTLQQLGRAFHYNPGAVPGRDIDPDTGRPETNRPLLWDDERREWYVEVLCNADELNAIRSYKPLFQLAIAQLGTLGALSDTADAARLRQAFFPSATEGTNVPSILGRHRFGSDSKILRKIRNGCTFADMDTIRQVAGERPFDTIQLLDEDACTEYVQRLKRVESAAVRRQVQDFATSSAGGEVINDNIYDEDTDNDHPESIAFIERVQDRIATLYPGVSVLRRILLLDDVPRGDEKRRVLDAQAAALGDAYAARASSSSFDPAAFARDLVSTWSVVKWTPYLAATLATVPYVRMNDQRIAALIRTVEPGPADSATPRITMEFTSEESVVVRLHEGQSQSNKVKVNGFPVRRLDIPYDLRCNLQAAVAGNLRKDAHDQARAWILEQPIMQQLLAEGFKEHGMLLVTDDHAHCTKRDVDLVKRVYTDGNSKAPYGIADGAWKSANKIAQVIVDIRSDAPAIYILRGCK